MLADISFSGKKYSKELILLISKYENIKEHITIHIYEDISILNHKENVEYGSQEHFCISSTLLQYTRNMLSSARKLRANEHIFISRFPTIKGGFKIWSVIFKKSVTSSCYYEKPTPRMN